MENLVGAVRWLQANRVPDRHGHEWVQWLEQNEKGVLRDPARHTSETLRSFLEDVQEGLCDLVATSAKKREQALQHLSEVLGENGQRLLKLLRLTKEHHHFCGSFACLGLRASKPPRLKRQGDAPENVEDLLLAVDCEMVATETDDNALARVCVCDASGKVLMDRLVRPPDAVTDARTAITGIQVADLEQVDFDLSEAQAELRKLMGPSTVLVGHTLHRDLDALRMDALLIFDISLLYGVVGQPKRRPALAHLVQEVLGRNDFRTAGGTEVHDCVQDVLMTMELALHRLRGKDVATVWVAAPSSNDAEAPRKLYFHRIPQREDVFQALGKLFARMQVSMEALRMLKGDKFTAAEVVFTSQEQAEAAFLALPAEDIEIDQAQRPQKMVRLHFSDRSALVCARPVLAGVGKQCLEPEKVEETLSAEAAKKMWEGKGWPGWRRAAEEALKAAPAKKLHWKKLAAELVQRRRLQAGGNVRELAEPLDVLELRALASLPEEFLGADAYVRLQ